MGRTPETLARHELVGLEVRVVAAANPDLVGVGGTVVGETTNTLRIERDDRAWPARTTRPRDASREDRADDARETQVPKAAVTFEFALDGGQRVRVEGDRLVARPARRTEHTGDSTWR